MCRRCSIVLTIIMHDLKKFDSQITLYNIVLTGLCTGNYEGYVRILPSAEGLGDGQASYREGSSTGAGPVHSYFSA